MKVNTTMKIGTKLLAAFSIVFILLFIVACWSANVIRTTSSDKDKVYKQYGKASGDFGMAYSKYQEGKFKLRNVLYIYVDNPAKAQEDITNIYNIRSEYKEYIKKFEEVINPEDKEIIQLKDDMMEAVDSYFTDVDECIELYNNGQMDEAREILTVKGISIALKADSYAVELLQKLNIRAEEQTDKVDQEVNILILGVYLLSIVALAIGILFEINIIRAIKRPLRSLVDASHKLAVGDVEINVEKHRDDEFGILIDNFMDMAKKIKAEAYIVKEIAAGNLTVNVVPKSSDDVMGNALLQVITDNNRVLSHIHAAAMQVTSGAGQVASASQSLAQGSTEQASAIQQITASMDEIAERTRTNAEQANQANTLVTTAKEDAKRGNLQMKDMICAMTEINRSSENISKIIKVIDDIAFQTNILALNAAVEAARAGTHGKGFAVVAEEVRNLAGKSASAASETAEMIEDSIRKVEQGSRLASETAKALEEIVTAVEGIVGLISSIALTCNEQATEITQIDQAIVQVSQVVQNNSSTSEECAAASEELSKQSVKLRNMINKYRLNGVNYAEREYNSQESSYSFSQEDCNESIISLSSSLDKY